MSFVDKGPKEPRGSRKAAPAAHLVAGALAAVLTLGVSAVAAAPVRHAKKVELTALPDRAALVAVTFSAVPTYTARLDRNGRRIVVDVPDADIAGAQPALIEPAGVVGGVMTQAFVADGSSTTRVIITLREDSRYRIAIEGTQIVVRLSPGKPGLDQPVLAKGGAPGAEQAPRVTDVRFAHHAASDEITIDATRVPKFRQLSLPGGRTRLVLEGAHLSESLERTLDVTAFAGLVSTVSSYRDDSLGATVIEVLSEEALDARAERRGSALVWSFFRSGRTPATVSGVGADGGAARRSRTLHVEDTYRGIAPVGTDFRATLGAPPRLISGESAAAFTPAIAGQAEAAAPGRYGGRRIDLDLKDADIHNVLRLLADVGRVNIVTADNVQGTVTIRMRNIPWDQALDMILQSKNLGMIQRGPIVRVAPLAELEKEREMAIARARQELELAPVETRLIPVSYAQASEIQARAKDLLSSRGSIAVDTRTNVLIVRDVLGNLDQIEELTRSLDTQTPQVLVEARIVEATSRYLRDFGVQWGGDATFSAATGNPTGVAFPNSVGLVGGSPTGNAPTSGLSPFTPTVANPNFAVNLPAAVGAGSGGALGLTFGSVDNNFNLNLRLSAAESNGMLRILSSPRILTLDNHEARIAQGTLIPFSQVSAQGVQTTFQEAKLQLLVKPHVTADGSISMHVKINRDEPDFNQTSARGDPTILKREAETELLVMDGNTAVIGGIYTRNTGRNLDQVPFFGDIPLIGLLFQHRRASDTRGELVIFLTPRIVNRAEALGR